jgi:hypothetical protein
MLNSAAPVPISMSSECAPKQSTDNRSPGFANCAPVLRKGQGSVRKSQVVEIASNDGYLLQHFLPLGVPVIGIEPAANVAEVARQKNIPTLVEFFDLKLVQQLVSEGRRADLIIGNNVLAQVPDLNDFTRRIRFRPRL